MPDAVVEQHEPGLTCPVCRVALVMSERQNIEIDYCPKCRGVWLDRGELDKIIDRSLGSAQAEQPKAVTPAPAYAQPAPNPPPYAGDTYDQGYGSRQSAGHGSGHGSKHGSSHGSSHGRSDSGHSGYRRKSWPE